MSLAEISLLAFLAAGVIDGPAHAGEEFMSGVVEGNQRFAVELYGRLREKPGNLFCSPASISTALAMTWAGARGETAEQMAGTLHLDGKPESVHAGFRALGDALRPHGDKPGYRLSVANRLWGQEGYHFLPDFLAVTRESYHAELAPVNFSGAPEPARLQINQWVEEQTEKRIKDLVPPGVITPLTRLVLTNAIYFKGDWARPFPKEATKEADFHVGGDKTTRVPLMHRTDDLRLGAADGMQMLELAYGQGDLSALVILPDAVDGLAAVEAKLSPEALARWRGSLRKRKVDVFLPRFRMTSQFSLADVLSAMGMPLAFDERRADFSGISTQDKLFLSAVLHKAFVDVNEEGTEAAAATAAVIGVRSVARPEPPAVFRADHPFLFAIVHNKTGSLLFLGRLANPS